MEEKKRVRVNLTVREDVLEAARRQADKELRSLSNLVEIALMDRIESAEK